MMRNFVYGLPLVVSLVSACASPLFDVGRTETVLPLNRAWINGQQVQYVTTDVSDLAMATMAGVNYAPRLRNAITADSRSSVLERVYKFQQGEQISIFQSAPLPAGASNTDFSYSPLWRVVLVNWRNSDRLRELKSEEELLSAEDKGDVSLTVTDIVVNCPVTRSADGRSLVGTR